MPKKQIEMMAEMGIGLEGPELKPDEKNKTKKTSCFLFPKF